MLDNSDCGVSKETLCEYSRNECIETGKKNSDDPEITPVMSPVPV